MTTTLENTRASEEKGVPFQAVFPGQLDLGNATIGGRYYVPVLMAVSPDEMWWTYNLYPHGGWKQDAEPRGTYIDVSIGKFD